MTIFDKVQEQREKVSEYFELFFKCANIPTIAILDPQTVSDCCAYVTTILEDTNIPYVDNLKRYCGEVLDPPPVVIPIPPKPDPDLDIVKPPKKILRDSEGNDDFLTDDPINDTLPVLPDRVLPPQPREQPITTDNNNNFSSYVCETLTTREYGCLVHDPWTERGFEYCYHGTEPNTFWDALLLKSQAQLEERTNETEEEREDSLAKSGVSRLTLPFFQQAVVLFGGNLLEDIATYLFERNKNIVNFPLGGYVFTAQANVTQCPIALEEDITDLEDNLKECDLVTESAIPLSFFSKDQEFHQGLRQQLTILFRNADYSQSNRKPKQFTIPSVPLDFSVTLLKNLLPDWLYFGQGRFEGSVNPYGYIRYYGLDSPSEQTIGDVMQWYENLISGLVRKDDDTVGSLKEDSFRFSKKTRAYATGWYYPHSYQLQGFRDDNQTWGNLRGDRIGSGQPSENPPQVDPDSWFVKF